MKCFLTFFYIYLIFIFLAELLFSFEMYFLLLSNKLSDCSYFLASLRGKLILREIFFQY